MTHASDPVDAGELRALGDHIESLLTEVRSMTSRPAWERVEELVHSLMTLYGGGLRRIADVLGVDDAGRAALARLGRDDLVASLLLLHDAHPEDTAARVRRALDTVRPYLGSHGGDVELLAVESDGTVRLRLGGSCDGCPSSARTVALAVEGAIREHAPEVTAVAVDGAPAAVPALPLTATAAPVWIDLDGIRPPAAGQVAAADVDGGRIVLCRSGETLFAYRDGCPGCGAALDGADLHGDLLTCAACGQRFDVRQAGRAVAAPARGLEPIPLLESGGGVRIAMAAA